MNGMEPVKSPKPHPWEATLDPDILAAKDDVDMTLIAQSLAMTPGERLDASSRFLRALVSFRPLDDTPEDR